MPRYCIIAAILAEIRAEAQRPQFFAFPTIKHQKTNNEGFKIYGQNGPHWQHYKHMKYNHKFHSTILYLSIDLRDKHTVEPHLTNIQRLSACQASLSGPS